MTDPARSGNGRFHRAEPTAAPGRAGPMRAVSYALGTLPHPAPRQGDIEEEAYAWLTHGDDKLGVLEALGRLTQLREEAGSLPHCNEGLCLYELGAWDGSPRTGWAPRMTPDWRDLLFPPYHGKDTLFPPHYAPTRSSWAFPPGDTSGPAASIWGQHKGEQGPGLPQTLAGVLLLRVQGQPQGENSYPLWRFVERFMAELANRQQLRARPASWQGWLPEDVRNPHILVGRELRRVGDWRGVPYYAWRRLDDQEPGGRVWMWHATLVWFRGEHSLYLVTFFEDGVCCTTTTSSFTGTYTEVWERPRDALARAYVAFGLA